ARYPPTGNTPPASISKLWRAAPVCAKAMPEKRKTTKERANRCIAGPTSKTREMGRQLHLRFAAAVGALPGGGHGFAELGLQGLGDAQGVLGFHEGVEFGRDLEEFAVAGLPDFEEGTGVEAAFDGAALVETVLELLADEVFLQALAAGVFEDTGEPKNLLTVETGEGVLGVRHGAIEI